MHKMATAFNTTVAALEDELTQLILEGLINARIDSHSKVSVSEPQIMDWIAVLRFKTQILQYPSFVPLGRRGFLPLWNSVIARA